jgi:hypothetical protein
MDTSLSPKPAAHPSYSLKDLLLMTLFSPSNRYSEILDYHNVEDGVQPEVEANVN